MGTFWGLIFQRVPFSFKQKRIDRVRNYGYGNIQADFDGDVVDKGDENLRLLDFIRSSENMILIKGNHEYLFERYLQGTISAELWDACGGSVTRAEVLSYNIQLQTSVKAPCQFREYAEEWGPKYLQYADSI